MGAVADETGEVSGVGFVRTTGFVDGVRSEKAGEVGHCGRRFFGRVVGFFWGVEFGIFGVFGLDLGCL